MVDIQECKFIILKYFEEMEAARSADTAGVIEKFTAPNYRLRGVHPFNELESAAQVAADLWQPMHSAFTSMQRRQEIFMAGRNRIDGTIWVTSMGKFLGLFDNDWLDIPPTGKITFVPYCEFHRIADEKIAESALWLDIVCVMKQGGFDPLPTQTGAEVVNPGPRTCDGLMFEAQHNRESKKTLNLIIAMCEQLIGEDLASLSGSLGDFWHDEMAWFGPSGIGATYTIDGYQRWHQAPFRSGIDSIDFKGHLLEHAEGNYGAWFGWPNMIVNQGGGFLGLPPSDRPTEMRVVDVYRREGDKLAEGWTFIDILHYMLLLGVDVLGRCRTISRA